MIRERVDGEFRYGDVAVWAMTGQEVLVINDDMFPARSRLVTVTEGTTTRLVPASSLTLRRKAEDNLKLYDDWFEERDDTEADQL